MGEEVIAIRAFVLLLNTVCRKIAEFFGRLALNLENQYWILTGD